MDDAIFVAYLAQLAIVKGENAPVTIRDLLNASAAASTASAPVEAAAVAAVGIADATTPATDTN